MTIEELGVRLKELEITCSTVSDELDAIRQRAGRLEGLEQDKDTLMVFYGGALPEELERLKPEERHRVYGMLRLEVSALPDGTI
jgi:hypothetical protein